MARAKITGVFKVSEARKLYVVLCNRDIFDDGWIGEKSMQVIPAIDELDAYKKGEVLANEWNERDKAQRQALRSEAKKDKGK